MQLSGEPVLLLYYKQIKKSIMHTTQKPKDNKAQGAAPTAPKAEDKKMDDKNGPAKPGDAAAKNRFARK
jgi:hypothetical protein